jgi:hypothetical protein
MDFVTAPMMKLIPQVLLQAANVVKKEFSKTASPHMDGFPKTAAYSIKKSGNIVNRSGF